MNKDYAKAQLKQRRLVGQRSRSRAQPAPSSRRAWASKAELMFDMLVSLIRFLWFTGPRSGAVAAMPVPALPLGTYPSP